jgi:glycerol-3-phosphate dehydrogenase
MASKILVSVLLTAFFDCAGSFHIPARSPTTLFQVRNGLSLRTKLQNNVGVNVGVHSFALAKNSIQRKPPGRIQMGFHSSITYPVRVAILGGGNFGLCLAVVLGNKNIPVTILVRKEHVASTINSEHHHPTFLSDVKLPLCVTATTDPALALADAAFIIHAVPVQFSRAYLRSISSHVGVNTPIICTSKGIESGTLTLMKDILYQELGSHRELAFLSGPSFAREIATGLATAVVIASNHEVELSHPWPTCPRCAMSDACSSVCQRLAKEVAELFSGPTFRVFTSRDVIGVEIGGAVKNVVAIAAGMCEGAPLPCDPCCAGRCSTESGTLASSARIDALRRPRASPQRQRASVRLRAPFSPPAEPLACALPQPAPAVRNAARGGAGGQGQEEGRAGTAGGASRLGPP